MSNPIEQKEEESQEKAEQKEEESQEKAEQKEEESQEKAEQKEEDKRKEEPDHQKNEKEDKENLENLKEDDPELFDKLEENFEAILDELAKDHSLDRFKKEYESLHRELAQIHGFNLILCEKIREINNEIASNASKVSSVLKMSQDDQNTITTLRTEFDKAWKQVELGQEKQSKHGEVIEVLKIELANLNRLSEQGENSVLNQDNKNQEISDEIDELKKEIDTQKLTTEHLNSELQEEKKRNEQLQSEIQKLSVQSEDFSTQYSELKEHADSVKKATEDMHKEVTELKSKILPQMSELSDKQQRASDIQENITLIQTKSREDEKQLKNLINDQINLHKKMKTSKKSLQNRNHIRSKYEKDIIDANRTLIEKDQQIQNLQKMNKKCTRENENLTQELNTIKENDKKLTTEKGVNRDKIVKLQNVKYQLKNELNSKDFSIGAERRDVERKRKDRTNAIQQLHEEKELKQFYESQNDVLKGDVSTMKGSKYNQGKMFANVQVELDQYHSSLSYFKAQNLQIQEQEKLNVIEIDNLNVFLSNIEHRTSHQVSMIETIQHERDLLRHKVEDSLKDTQELESTNLALNRQIEALKEDVRTKDKICLETHLKQKKLKAKIKKMEKEYQTLNEELHKLNDDITEYKNRIQRSRYLFSQAELETTKQKQVVNDLRSRHSTLDISLMKRIKEIQLYKEKSHTLLELLSHGQNSYIKQVEKIEKLKNSLQTEVQKNEKLFIQCQHLKLVKQEEIHLQSFLNSIQGKAHALEDELEHPINVHRWHILEGTNPELFQMLKMNQELQQNLIVSISVIQRLKSRLQTFQDKQSLHQRKAVRNYEGDLSSEETYLQDVLREKNNQIKEISNRLSGQHSQVVDQKETVGLLKDMVKESKIECNGTKKKIINLRLSTKTRSFAHNDNPNVPKFVGGGFPIGGFRQEPSKRTLARYHSQILSPAIIKPKTKPPVKFLN